MTNAHYTLEEYRDIEIRNMAAERLAKGYSMESVMESIHAKGRDNGRTPMQWDASENAGFTAGTPWLKVNPNYTDINVARQESRDSILNYYRYLVALRKREDVILDGSYEEILPQRDDLFCYARDDGKTRLTVVVNFTSETVAFPAEILEAAGEPELSNYLDWPIDGVLRPWEARMYIKR